MDENRPQRCGYVAIIGRPNVGKSTLLNHMLGQKISITSRKPQTTRHRVLGIKTEGDDQVVFVDTPGLHRGASKAINRYMNRAASSAITDVDAVVMVVDRTAWTEEDEWVLEQAVAGPAPVILAVNKVDKLENKAELLPHLQFLSEQADFKAIVPISALNRHNIDERVIGFLRFRPDLLFDFNPEHNPVAFPSPRSWEFAHRALYKFGDQPQLLVGGLEACVGKAAGVELFAYIQSLENLPDIDAILRGESSESPDEIDLQYAVATALVSRAMRSGSDSATLGNILDYAAILKQREMGVMLVSDLQRAVGHELFAVPQFANWADTVGDILVY